MGEKADIEYDNIRNPEIFDIGRVFVWDDEYKMGAIQMLLMISQWEGWEASELHYYRKFFKKDLSEMKI